MTIAKLFRVPRERIKKVLKLGRRLKNGPITAVLLGNNLNTSRIAVVISSKAIRKSVVRNKIRRRIKEIFKKIKELLDKNYDVVIIIYSDNRSSFKDLEQLLFGAFLTAKVIK
ncbi:MAG: ribonuclease P protein component [Patescibacteria group bacterium]